MRFFTTEHLSNVTLCHYERSYSRLFFFYIFDNQKYNLYGVYNKIKSMINVYTERLQTDLTGLSVILEVTQTAYYTGNFLSLYNESSYFRFYVLLFLIYDVYDKYTVYCAFIPNGCKRFWS